MVRANTGRGTRSRDARRATVSVAAVLAVVVGMVLAGPSGSARAATQVDLGTAESFAVLAGSAISNTGPTTINGDVGLHPGGPSSVTGFSSVTLNGQPHYGDGVALQAKSDLTTAYNNAASQPTSATVATDLGTQVLTGGVYRSASGTFGMTGTLTLDAQGTAGTVWIFQTDTTLVTASNSRVVLINGADPCNVFWQVGSSATLGTGTSFAGNILAAESVTLNTSATISGRALARNAAVTMDTNTITAANCPAQVTPPPPSPSPTPTASPSPSPSPSPVPSPTPSSSTSPAPVATTAPPESALPVDSPTDPTGGTTGTPGAPDAPDAPDAPVAGAPPADGGTPQVPSVPRGAVPAGDGSMSASGGWIPAVLLLSFLSTLMAVVVWRRRDA